ncbi:hypothetical protein KIW84_023774 [Lathyrus oleraceus]|uniref:Uncharacterized protein n=1 Tax=Pisum sativum TaxID=3888 RepID=A0A9D4YFU7_PEA|nr:hypothetical protein KIW84_023774 [Pisum sativum]
MESSQHVAEWNEVQRIAISVDLVDVAKKQLEFLADVDINHHLYDGPVLDRTIYRYHDCWLPVLAKYSESRISEGPLVVPLDCEWIWHCHRLNPELLAAKWKKIWNNLYPDEPYNSDLIDSLPKYIKYDLISAVKRQIPFLYQISKPSSHNASDDIRDSTGIVGRESLERLRSSASTPGLIELQNHSVNSHSFSSVVGSSLSRSTTLESHIIGRPVRYGLPHVGSEVCSVEKSGAGLSGIRD